MGLPFFFLWVGLGFFFQVVFGAERGLSTVHFPLGQLTVAFSCKHFPFSFYSWGGGGGCRVVNAKSSQVPDVFPKEFPIACHFYPICFGKCCRPSTRVGGSKGRNSKFQNRTLYFLHRFVCFVLFFFWEWWANQIGSLQKENWIWDTPHVFNANHNRCSKKAPPVHGCHIHGDQFS
jgi:hypothetical protein